MLQQTAFEVRKSVRGTTGSFKMVWSEVGQNGASMGLSASADVD